MGRDAELFVAVGQKGSGKTTTTLEKDLKLCVRGNPATGARPRKVLIFDTQLEYPFIKTLPIDKIGLFSIHNVVEMRRIIPFTADNFEMTQEEKVEVVKHILKYYFNACLVLEDTSDYIFDYMPGDILSKILGQRHRGVDIFLHYQSLGRIQKKVWPHINEMRLHKCEDNVIDNREKFPEKFEMFKIAENIVNRQYQNGNEYFYVTILNRKRKIITDISEEEKKQAIEEYLSVFHKRLIQPYLVMADKHGKKTYNRATAWDLEMQRLNTTYFTA